MSLKGYLLEYGVNEDDVRNIISCMLSPSYQIDVQAMRMKDQGCTTDRSATVSRARLIVSGLTIL